MVSRFPAVTFIVGPKSPRKRIDPTGGGGKSFISTRLPAIAFKIVGPEVLENALARLEEEERVLCGPFLKGRSSHHHP
jgi:hypothetical protein